MITQEECEQLLISLEPVGRNCSRSHKAELKQIGTYLVHKKLAEANIKYLGCSYEGCSDSGDIENFWVSNTSYIDDVTDEIEFFEDLDTPLNNLNPLDILFLTYNFSQAIHFNSNVIDESYLTLTCLFQSVLDFYIPAGFEINDGSFGSLELDVQAKKFTLYNNIRVTTTELESEEIAI
jgi:hypothetical protein